MILKFRDEYHFLSNFVSVDIVYDGALYPSVEHAYQSAKSNDLNWKKFCRNPLITASEVKTKSYEISNKIENWHSIKLEVMELCLIQKFSKEPFRNQLLATGNENIQEGNWWNDTFWGIDLTVDPNIGENHLGRLLMKIRDDIKRSN